MKNLVFVGIIWLCCTLAWVILGSSLIVRSGEQSNALTDEVYRLWGPPLRQVPPSAQIDAATITKVDQGSSTSTETQTRPVTLTLSASALDTRLELEHRRKGLLWFPTYALRFVGQYEFMTDSAPKGEAVFRFPLASRASEEGSSDWRGSEYTSGVGQTTFDNFQILDEAGNPVDTTILNGVAEWRVRTGPHERHRFTISYQTRGTSRWFYDLTNGSGQSKAFRLSMSTNFDEVDFPAGSVSPTHHEVTDEGWQGQWEFSSLVANTPVGIELPQRLNPGPLASRMTFFAPVGLLFFFFVTAMLTAVKRIGIHPVNYFFFGCAFFAFHLLFAYLVDHLTLPWSFGLAAIVSTLLVLSYARLFVGWRFAAWGIAVPQVLYLVLFSFTFFWSGFTGLAITIGAVVTLFVMMQISGRMKWERTPPAPKVAPPRPEVQSPAAVTP